MFLSLVPPRRRGRARTLSRAYDYQSTRASDDRRLATNGVQNRACCGPETTATRLIATRHPQVAASAAAAYLRARYNRYPSRAVGRLVRLPGQWQATISSDAFTLGAMRVIRDIREQLARLHCSPQRDRWRRRSRLAADDDFACRAARGLAPRVVYRGSGGVASSPTLGGRLLGHSARRRTHVESLKAEIYEVRLRLMRIRAAGRQGDTGAAHREEELHEGDIRGSFAEALVELLLVATAAVRLADSQAAHVYTSAFRLSTMFCNIIRRASRYRRRRAAARVSGSAPRARRRTGRRRAPSPGRSRPTAP